MTDRIARFVDAVKDDPRVLAVARSGEDPVHDPALLVVSTWDGGETLPADLPRLGALLVGEGARIEKLRSPAPEDSRMTAIWTGIGTDGSRAAVGLRRIGDLVPSFDGKSAAAVHDPHGFVATWIRYSNKASREELAAEHAEFISDKVDEFLHVDSSLRHAASGFTEWSHAPHDWLRSARSNLDVADAAQAALASRIDAHLRAEPGRAAGLRVPGGDDPATRLEAFLRVADDEGFKGDRVLFGEAVKHLRELSKREPVFDQGFVVPTFDAVEAGFALGEAVGGCQPPLIPGVYVGVGVTPKDALEFWAAPFVRDPTCTVACVDDTGDRDVVLRTAGRDPMVAALTKAIDAAWARLPGLVDSARAAADESVDPVAALATLHLPRSFNERAKVHGAGALMCSRLTVALAVARAGNDCAPLVARKLGLAAGRVLSGR